MKKIFKQIVVFVFLLAINFSFFVFTSSANSFKTGLINTASNAGYNVTNVSNPETSLITTINKVVGAILSFLGVILMILIFYAGFVWMTARGDAAKVTKAKDTLFASIIGLIVVVAAYAISYFVINALQKSTLNITAGS